MVAKKLGLEPLIDPTAKVRQARLGRYTEIGARTSFAESTLGDYSYVVNDADVIYTTIGKFCSIAAQYPDQSGQPSDAAGEPVAFQLPFLGLFR